MNRIARRRLPTPARLPHTARGALIAMALALVVAAPAAAAQPTRTVYHGGQPFTIPADKACPFPVEGQPSGGFAAYKRKGRAGGRLAPLSVPEKSCP